MNIYVLVEGKCEKKVYKSWIPYVNPCLTYVEHPSEMENNHFSIVSSMGYPQYLEDVESAVIDVASSTVIDRLVVAIDSEEMTREEKYGELDELIRSVDAAMDYRIIVQHFCLEAWALGNSRIVGLLPQDPILRKYKEIYDVRERDPEGLLAFEEWNRAKFAYQYLRAAFRDRWGSLVYSKSKPGHLATSSYYQRLYERLNDTGHIDSFAAFNGAFS